MIRIVMKDLIDLARKISAQNPGLPFSVYASTKEQILANVPVIKPLLIFVLSGMKQLGDNDKIKCQSGNFIFLSNSPNVDMRNIPDETEYFAILIEFEYSDFLHFSKQRSSKKKYFQGQINLTLEKALHQYIEWSVFAPPTSLQFRRQEILHLMVLSGHDDIFSVVEPPSLSHKIHEILNENLAADWTAERLAERLSMSESTLRRKLRAEGNSIQVIRNRARLGLGLHLIQTTMEHVGRIAERCGYQSQSRFTDRFKLLFGMTPTELRKTRMTD